MTRHFLAAFGPVLLLSLAPEGARAHSTFEGINDFYNGLLHPAFVPAHLLAALTIGLFIGQQGIKELFAPLMGFVIALVSALIFVGFAVELSLDALLLAMTLALGLLIALSRDLPAFAKVGAAAIIGAAIGLGSAPGAVLPFPRVVTLLGTALGASLLLIYSAALGEICRRRPWRRIALRVLGSWAAAASIMVLSLTVFGPR